MSWKKQIRIKASFNKLFRPITNKLKIDLLRDGTFTDSDEEKVSHDRSGGLRVKKRVLRQNMESEKTEWGVRCLSNRRKRNGVAEYQVSWEKTWEPYRSLPPDLINEYKDRARKMG